MPRIALLTRPDYRSPRILAESLQLQLVKSGATADIFFNIDALTRLFSFNESKHKYKFHFWLQKKLSNFIKDAFFYKQLSHYDAVIICECTPNGFWKDHYNVEKLKKIIGKPVLYYEVYYLGNTPTQISILQSEGHPLIERYDWHLAAAYTTEIKLKHVAPWSCVGIDLTNLGLKPNIKEEFIALVDFKQPGYEGVQATQLAVLNDLGIKTIVLEGRYKPSEIRKLYQQASVFFIQFPEAFGLPIAECFACGVQVFSANSGWPMSWRLDDDPAVHGPGKLPDIFTTYNSAEDLKQKLKTFKESYDLTQTPQRVFSEFISNYPHYYYGNPFEIEKLKERIQLNSFH